MVKKVITEKQKLTARYAKALGHPVRISILQMLARHTYCYHSDMSQVLPVAKSTLSQHLNELKDAGLIQGEINPPSVRYHLNRENWAKARKLLGDLLKQAQK